MFLLGKKHTVMGGKRTLMRVDRAVMYPLYSNSSSVSRKEGRKFSRK